MNHSWRDRLILFTAQGFGSGRIPFAPGTFGSIVGILFFLGIVGHGILLFAGAIVISIFLSAVFCGEAEIILKEKDPGSVVLDEIIAIPICCIAWVLAYYFERHQWPATSYFLERQNYWRIAAIFGLFRLFDIWKPWPVRQSQDLPGGWGVTIDDVLAAVYVNVVCAIYILIAHPII